MRDSKYDKKNNFFLFFLIMNINFFRVDQVRRAPKQLEQIQLRQSQ